MSFSFSWTTLMRVNWLAALLSCIFLQTAACAKIEAVIHTAESMKEHNCPEPRRLMHDIVVQEFNKGNVIHIVNTENSAQPKKFHLTPFHVGANLIAFQAAPDMPVQVSLCIQLVRYKTGQVIMATNKATLLSPAVIAAALKLQQSSFDKSQYGLAITVLSQETARAFAKEASEMKLE